MDFVSAAVSGRRARAEALPADASDPWVRLVRGEGWDGDVNAPGGPLGWAPLLYVCHSVYGTAALARELLARGADPNATFTNEYGEMSALYGAAGRLHDPELTRVLLEAGADPDDGESVYHATEAASPECLRLLLEHDATVEPIMVAHALDGEDRLEHVRILLATGVDASQLLPHAVRRGRGPAYLRLLVDHGADLEYRGGEEWRGDIRRRTAYQHAVLRNADAAAAALAELGARTDVAPDDLAVAALARGETPAALPDAFDHDQQEVLILAALHGRAAHVVDLLGSDFTGVVGGSPPGSLLAHASWVGDADLVAYLLERGAAPVSLDWAVHGSGNAPGGDHVRVAQLLLAAGATVEPRHREEADGPLAESL